MNRISCIVVEDEPASQDIMKTYIADYPVLELKTICNNAIEASEAVQKHRPDVLFLDINMPKMSGLEFYSSLTNPPYVIFTTAYPEFAIEGFEVDAVDYLVKPFSFTRFVKAVNKLQEKINIRVIPQDSIMLQADKKIHRVPIAEILFLEAMGDYVKVHFNDRSIIVHQTLQKLQMQLPLQFVRVHKSYVVSLSRIDYVEGNVIFIQGKQVAIGQTYRNDFINVLNSLK
jgi:DNA-binding LytR/AlgR family response regulator